MHCHAELRLSSPGQLKAARRRYKTFMIDEILSKETCDYFEKLSLYSVCPSLVVRPKPLHSCTVPCDRDIQTCPLHETIRLMIKPTAKPFKTFRDEKWKFCRWLLFFGFYTNLDSKQVYQKLSVYIENLSEFNLILN
ncbi:hypothetical protein MJG53_016753 [Ovis ammon polii x Ovis aries]|uniref:Uncharacterized protein n=1 Tax=Ovis ammon polii x Ovis aries TaxID=2918886 RepID=A0ACB9U9L1_9CETA|nr:hypothetical protein MJG53_016753 [Ovis ammon polii x Ovis aries]